MPLSLEQFVNPAEKKAKNIFDRSMFFQKVIEFHYGFMDRVKDLCLRSGQGMRIFQRIADDMVDKYNLVVIDGVYVEPKNVKLYTIILSEAKPPDENKEETKQEEPVENKEPVAA